MVYKKNTAKWTGFIDVYNQINYYYYLSADLVESMGMSNFLK